MNNHNGVNDNVNQKHIFNNEEMETKMREIAENENITFLKTLIKFKSKNDKQPTQIVNNYNKPNIISNDNNNNNSFTNKEDNIDKQEDDSKSYIKEILDICGNSQTTPQQFPTISISPNMFQQNLQINSDVINNNEKGISSRKIMEDNSISSIQSLEQDHQNQIDNDDIKMYDNDNDDDIQFTNQNVNHKIVYECEPLSNFKEVTNAQHNVNYNNNKGKANDIVGNKKGESNKSANTKRGNKTKFFNNKKNIMEIEKLIKETKSIEKGLIFRPFSNKNNLNLQTNFNTKPILSNIAHTTGNDNSNKKTITPLDVYFNSKNANSNYNYYTYITAMAFTSPNEIHPYKGDVNKDNNVFKANNNNNKSSNKKGKQQQQQQIQAPKIHYKKKDKSGTNSYTEEAKRVNKSKKQSKKEFIVASINLFDSAKKQKSKEYLKTHNTVASKNIKTQKQK